jgi:hypothetical protein
MQGESTCGVEIHFSDASPEGFIERFVFKKYLRGNVVNPSRATTGLSLYAEVGLIALRTDLVHVS